MLQAPTNEGPSLPARNPLHLSLKFHPGAHGAVILLTQEYLDLLQPFPSFFLYNVVISDLTICDLKD